MKTNLDRKIKSWDEAKLFLTELYNNDEAYHPEDDAFDIEWDTCNPTDSEKTQLNKLMNDIYLLPEMKDYPNVEQCPCGVLLDLQKSDNNY